MDKNHHYRLSGSFDGLADDVGGNHRHYFKSSFAKSMALETTKSLNSDLDYLTSGNGDQQQRFNTIGSPHRRANRRNSQRFESNGNNGSFQGIEKDYKHLQKLYDELSAKHEKLARKDANVQEAPCIELTLAKSQVDTLQWQLKQVEATNQMYKAVLEQVSKFLEKAYTSLNTAQDKPNLPIKNRRLSLKNNTREECVEKLSLEAYRLHRTVQSLTTHTKEPDLVQHLTPCYSTLFEKNGNSSSLCSCCDSSSALCNGVKCLDVSSSSSNHSETSSMTTTADFVKKETKRKNAVAVEDESGFSSIGSHDNHSSSPTYPTLGLPPIDKLSRRWSSVSASVAMTAPINHHHHQSSFNYHATANSNTSTPIKVCWV